MSWLLSCIGCGGKKFVEKEETRTLDFQHYSLKSVPPYVFECERFLEELYLDYNQIGELPKELFLCNELQILSLCDNDLHKLPPAISSLSNLTSLDLSKNGISDIPDNIKSCKRLRSVNVNTNPLCRLPEGFTQLVALKELSLNDTFLEYLPANFGRLTGLEVLELRENQLNTLPRSMTRLTALKKLDLGQNEFTELPEVLGHLSSLTDLWVDNNRVKRIPVEIGRLTQLTFLDMTKNRLIEIDRDLGNCGRLTHLYLTQNKLETLPDTLSNCTALTILHVDDNHLECLPEALGRIEAMKEIKASQNELSSIPSSVGLLRDLQVMHVDDNLLASLPSELGSCSSLVVLTAAHNQISRVPAELGSLSKLRVVNLCGNIIQDLPVSFTKLQLSSLWLSENQAKPSVPLQVSKDATGQKVLTCFMLPQTVAQDPVQPVRVDDDTPITEEQIEARRARRLIQFASEGDTSVTSRLSRVPTPYPKELRALAKHTKNIKALKGKGKEGDKVEDVMVSAKAHVDTKKKSIEEPPDPVAADKEEADSGAVLSSVILTEDDTKTALSASSGNVSPIADEELNDESFHVIQELCADDLVEESVVDSKVTQELVSKPVPSNITANYTPVYAALSSTSAVSYTKEYSKITNSVDESYGLNSNLRPASIAAPEHGPNLTRVNYSTRPGSLALEGISPSWTNNRPNSLAAPINIVGIPPAADLSLQSPAEPKEPVRRPFDVDLDTLCTPPNSSNSDTCVESPPDNSSMVQAMNEKNLVQSLHDHFSSTTNTQIVSIINQVTGDEEVVEMAPEGSQSPEIRTIKSSGSEDNQSPEIRTVKFSSSEISQSSEIRTSSRIPSFSSKKPSQISSQGPTENIPDDKQFASNLSKIPHFSTPKPASFSPQTSRPDSQNTPASGSRIKAPSNWKQSTQVSPNSPVQTTQSKRQVVSPPAVNDYGIQGYNQRSGLPLTSHKSESTAKEITKPSSKIPSYSSPPENKSQSRIPGFANQENRKIVQPGFKSSGLSTPDSAIPMNRGGSSIRTPVPMSPMEDPINQTGIPIVSPERADPDKSSRIPTFSNSSLRGKKAGRSNIPRSQTDM